jgi:hypothetical protein
MAGVAMNAPGSGAKDGLWRWLLLPGGQYHLLALTLFVAVFAIIPFAIYAHSGEDWGFAFAQVLSIATLGLALFVGFAVLIRLLAAWHTRTASTVAVLSFCLGVFVLLAHIYAPIQTGPLDGSEIESDEPILHSIIEIALLVGLIAAFVQLQRGRGLRIAASFSIALLLIAVVYGGFLTAVDQHARANAEEPAAAAAVAPVANSSDIDGNIYHFVLDRMHTEALLNALDRTVTANDFAGFELFENNISNYVWTLQSAASYFTGTYFKGPDYDRWIGDWRDGEGLLPALSAHGYRLWMYSPIENWKNRHVDVFQYGVDIYEEETGFSSAGFTDLIHIWLASLAPNLLTNEALSLAAPLAGPAFELLTGQIGPLSAREGLHQYAGLLTLRRLVREEPRRAPNGEYVYTHVLLPHGPYVFDSTCRYVGLRGKRPEPLGVGQAHLVQAECTLGLVVDFLRELQRLGRYDAATIVIHADTGDWMALGDLKKKRGRILGYPQRNLMSYVRALLMIKRPRAEGPLRIVETPTQLVDLYPTLLDILDLDVPQTHVDGRSIYSEKAGEPRETRVAFDPQAQHLQGRNLIEIRIEDPSDLTSSKLTVLGPADDPATWRTKSSVE